MKTFLGVALGALLLSAPVIATAASGGDAANMVGVVSTSETLGNRGSNQMPVFNYNAPASDPVTISTPYTIGNRGSNELPVFDYRGAVPLYASPFAVTGDVSGLPGQLGSTSLANGTGGGR